MPFRSTIRLLLTRDQFLSPPSIQTGDSDRHDYILVFSPNEMYAAFVRWGGDTFTILDLQSGDSRLVTSMDMGIGCLEMTESSVEC